MAGVHVVHQVDAAKAGDAAQQGSKQPSCCSQCVRLTTVRLRMVVACGAGVQSDAVSGGLPLQKARTLCGNRGTAPFAAPSRRFVDALWAWPTSRCLFRKRVESTQLGVSLFVTLVGDCICLAGCCKARVQVAVLLTVVCACAAGLLQPPCKVCCTESGGGTTCEWCLPAEAVTVAL